MRLVSNATLGARSYDHFSGSYTCSFMAATASARETEDSSISPPRRSSIFIFYAYYVHNQLEGMFLV
jgi:hypothetical protein